MLNGYLKFIKQGNGFMSYLSNRQIFFLVFLNLLGFSLFNNISTSVNLLDKSYYIGIILTFLFTLIPLLCFVFLQREFNDKNIYDYSKILLGKRAAIFISIIILLFAICFAAFNLKSISHIIKLSLLPNSNENLIAFSLIALGIYVASKGIRNVGRLCEIFGFLAIILFVASIGVMIFNVDILNTTPLITTDFWDKLIDYKLLNNVYYFFPIIILSVITIGATNKSKSNNKIKNNAPIVGYIIGGLVFLLLCFGCVGIMGVNQVKEYTDSLFVAIKQIELPFLTFLQRLDIIIVTAMLFAAFCTISSFILICYELIEKIFNFTKFRIIIILFLSFTFLSTIPQTIKGSSNAIMITGITLGIVSVFVVPIFLYCRLLIYKKKNLLKEGE